MKSINKVIIMGFAGVAPKATEENGQKVCRFSVATPHTYWEGAEKREEVIWHKVVCRGKLAEVCETFVDKGRAVYLEGALLPRHRITAEGEPRETVEIAVDSIQLLPAQKTIEASC